MSDQPARPWRRLAASAIGPIGILFGLYLLLGIGVVAPRITTDGLLYLAETRSAVLDGDLDLADEYRFDPAIQIPGASEGRREFLPRDLDGRFLHTANEGIIVLFAPFILVGHVFAELIAATGGPASMDGYDLPYVLAIGFGTNAMVAFALALLVAYARRYVGLAAAAGGAAAIWVGSSLFHWSVFRPGHAHAPAVLLEALFVVLFLARARDPRDRASWLAMGAIWGLAVTVRPITGMYAIVPLLWLAWLAAVPLVDALRNGARGRGLLPVVAAGLRQTVPAGVLFLAGGLVGRLPQVALTGDVSLAGSEYYSESGFLGGFDGGGPLAGLASLMFDPSQGTLFWVPLVALAIAGLAWYWRRDRLITIAGLIWVAAIWAVVSMLGYPERFGGPTYASRHLVEATPVYVLGAAGLVQLIRAGVHAVARHRPRVATIVAWSVLASTASWGAIQYIAAELVPGAAERNPIARMGQVLGNLPSLRRLWVGGSAGEPEPGVAFIGGRLAAGLGDRGDLGELALGLIILVILGAAWAAFARVGVGWALASAAPSLPNDEATAPPPGRRTGSWRVNAGVWAGRAAWVVAFVVVLGAVAPALVRPRLAEPADSAISRWTAGVGRPADGKVERISLGSSQSGNEVVSPPFVEPGVPDLQAASAPAGFATVTADGLSARIQPPNGWSALTGLRFDIEPLGQAAGLVIELRRAGDEAAALLVDVPPGALTTPSVRVATPLALAGPASVASPAVDIRIRPSGSAAAPRLGVTATGEVSLTPEGIATPIAPEVRIAGQPLFDGTVVSLPSQASIDVRADGWARMRVGPWGPDVMLRYASRQTGWSFPGPSTFPGTWTDSVIKASPSGAGLEFRIDAPWPIHAATASVMVSALERGTPAMVALAGSGDGSTFESLTTFAPLPVVRQQHLTGQFEPADGTTSVWFAVDLVGEPTTTGLNAVWFDLELAPPETTLATLASIDSRELEIVPAPAAPGVATSPVTIDVSVEPSVVEAIAWSANDAIGATFSSSGPVPLLLLGVGLLATAWFAIRSVGRTAAVGLLVLALVAAGTGIAGLPRTVLLPRTQALADGTLEGSTVRGRAIVASVRGATYISPIISIPVGSRLDNVSAAGRVRGSRVSIRSVATDGTPGPWEDPAAGMQTEADGLQVRVEFLAVGSRLERIRIDYRPPLGG